MPRLYLASQSPRRAALLQQIGVEFTQLPSTIDEQRAPAESAIDFVSRLAREKAAAGMALINAENHARAAVVLGADTIVVKDQRIFGKPQNEREYTEMLEHLSASWHQVLTAVALLRFEPTADPGQAGVEHFSTLSNTKVQFKRLSQNEVKNYWHTGEPRGKAGGYAIQGVGALLVASLNGSYTGVVGLPLYETGLLLSAAGVATALDGTY